MQPRVVCRAATGRDERSLVAAAETDVVPLVVSKYEGGALCALMVFVGFGFLVPRATVLSLMSMTFA